MRPQPHLDGDKLTNRVARGCHPQGPPADQQEELLLTLAQEGAAK